MATSRDYGHTNGANGGATADTGDGLEDTLDALNPDFRAQLGLLEDEEEGLTEAFKARLGMIGPEMINEITEVEIPLEEEQEETISRFKFDQFARDHFQHSAIGVFSPKPLEHSLLPKKHDLDSTASLAVWLAVLRFMGDLPSPHGMNPVRDKTPVMTKIYRTIEKHRTRRRSSTTEPPKTAPNDQRDYVPFKMRKRSSWKKIMGIGSKDKEREQQLAAQQQGAGAAGPNDMDYTGGVGALLQKIPTIELDVVHFIIGHGILRRELRDEIYCQICKQLTKNPSRDSQQRGWVLMALCAGCFLPTDQLIRYIRCFLKDAPKDLADYAAYTRKTMRRTACNGMRYHPPNWLELQATKLRKFVMLPVTFADGRVETLEADPATTSSEMCHKLANKIGLKDQFGFSIYICIYDKVSSLGNGLDHVMDAISECEQVVRSKGYKEEDAPWRLYFRKELFAPWHDPGYDEVSTNLIYQQVIRGIKSEEYRFKMEEDLSQAVAKRYYIENGASIVPGKLQASLHNLMPDSAFKGTKTRENWTQAIITAFDELGLAKSKRSIQAVKEDLVMLAPRKWPLQFSGLFEAFKIAGPRLPKNDVVIALGSRGLFVLDDPYKVVVALHFYEVVEVFTSRTGKMRGQSFSILTVKGDEYSFLSPNSATIAHLLSSFLDGLRRRSKVAVALQEFILQAQSSEPFRFEQGDILVLTDDETKQMTATRDDWCTGVVEKTKQKGTFPYDCIYVLPTLERPPTDFLSMFATMGVDTKSTLPRKRGAVILGRETIGRHGAHGKLSEA